MSHKIVAKYIIQAKLKSVSPFLISSGEGEETDKDVLLLPDCTSYIPGSSFAGVLRDTFNKSCFNGNKLVKQFLWGGKSNNQEFQSHLIINDLTSKDNIVVSNRDGIKINEITGIAEIGSKYDYQIIEPEVSFDLEIEATLRDGISKEGFEKALGILGEIIETTHFRIGAHTSFGFGKMECFDIKIYKFQFPENDESWFSFISNKTLPTEWRDWKDLVKNCENTQNQFKISASFKDKTSILTATYAVDPARPDKSQIKSNKKFVLSGKSIKGAIRHRGLKILKTQMSTKDAEEKLKDLMGWVNPDSPDEEATKSRLRIEESIIDSAVKPQEQPRIKINRFEGGTIKNALFSSEAVWQKKEKDFKIEMTLEDMRIDEARLLLQILKDLWTSDLAIGGEKNIGRGVLIGSAAEIEWKDNKVKFEAGEQGELIFTEGKLEQLNVFENQLN